MNVLYEHPCTSGATVPPVFVDPDPPVLFESALVFSYFSMALAHAFSTTLSNRLLSLNSSGRHGFGHTSTHSLRICIGFENDPVPYNLGSGTICNTSYKWKVAAKRSYSFFILSFGPIIIRGRVVNVDEE
ncbi:hypothetical protein Tco_1466323 [Tanacetum coccineum]